MRSHIGMVLQETWLSKDTIAANIAFGKPNATMDEIVEAAKKAHADEFIRRMPEGYQTVVSSCSARNRLVGRSDLQHRPSHRISFGQGF